MINSAWHVLILVTHPEVRTFRYDMQWLISSKATLNEAQQQLLPTLQGI